MKIIAEDAYLAERYSPRPGQPFYLHLSDLLIALEKHSTMESIRILDFGCGGSPYRSLFPNSEFLRADLPAMAGIDFYINDGGSVNAPSGTFDLVLSTQVLEHCPDPAVYLSEARRLLRPEGKLLLTTHGVFEDHGCPFDFLRWTSYGLERAITEAGFEVRKCQKLTTAGRALAFLMDYYRGWMKGSRRTIPGFFLWLTQQMIFSRRDRFHQWCDTTFGHCRVVDGHHPDHPIYIALLIDAVKKAE